MAAEFRRSLHGRQSLNLQAVHETNVILATVDGVLGTLLRTYSRAPSRALRRESDLTSSDRFYISAAWVRMRQISLSHESMRRLT